MSRNGNRNPRMARLSERHYCTHTDTRRASENRQQTEGLHCHQTRSLRVKRRNTYDGLYIGTHDIYVSHSREKQSRES